MAQNSGQFKQNNISFYPIIFTWKHIVAWVVGYQPTMLMSIIFHFKLIYSSLRYSVIKGQGHGRGHV